MEAARLSYEQHYLCCPGESDICLGNVESFDMTESGEVDVLIQDGRVYHFITCPQLLHGIILSELTFAFQDALAHALGRERYHRAAYWAGRAECLLHNRQGGGARQRKQPDTQMRVVRSLAKDHEAFPVLVFEVASRHEDLHKLLCEGAMWLNEETDVKMVVLTKLWPEERKLELFVFERSDDEHHNSIDHRRNLSVDEIRALPELGSYYHMKRVFHQTYFDEQHCQKEEFIELDMSPLFEDTDPDLAELAHNLVINLHWVLLKFFNHL